MKTTLEPAMWVVPLAAALGLVVIMAGQSDQVLFCTLNGLGPDTNEPFWGGMTILGDTVVCLALFLPLWRRRPDLLWALLVALAVSRLAVNTLKQWLAIPRPVAVLGDTVHVIGAVYRKYSFPSGHTATAFFAAGVLWMGTAPRPIAAAALLAACFCGLSRAVVGAHWPSDVLGGMAIGWMSAAAGLALGTRTRLLAARLGLSRLAPLLLAGCAVALLVGYDTGYPGAVALQRVLGAASLVLSAALLRLRAA